MIHRFADFALDSRQRTLMRGGERLEIEPQVFDLLAYFLSHPGDLVTQDDLIAHVWEGRIVSDAAIASRISTLRRIIGDNGRSQGLLRTHRGQGFRFVAQVAREGSEAPAVLVSRDAPALAVLPFADHSLTPDDVFAVGMVDEITTALSRSRDVIVIAHQSACALHDPRADLRDIAARLGADYLVEGVVRRAEERVRVTVTLAQGRDGHQLWSERFDDHMGDLFDLQDRIAEKVAGRISPSLRTAEIRRARARPPADRTAYDLTLMALPHFWRSRKPALEQAIELLAAAVAADPEHPRAAAYLAWAKAQLSSYMWSPDPAGTYAEARTLAREALHRAGDDAAALVALGAACSMAGDDPAEGHAVLERALAIEPSNAWGWLRLAWSHYYCGRPREALDAADRAEALSPLDPFLFNLCFARSAAWRKLGEVERALEANAAGMRLNPGLPWGYRQLLGHYLSTGDAENAQRTFSRMMDAHPGLTRRQFLASLPRGIAANNAEYIALFDAVDLPE